MQREIPSDLPKLGSREYIQGGTIFNGIVAAFDATLAASWREGARISTFKLEHEATANGRLVVTDEAWTGAAPNAVLTLRTPSGQVQGLFFDEGREFRREPYDEESFNIPRRIGGDLGGEFELPSGHPPADFIKGVVGANKLLHQRTDRFGDSLTKIQFLYLKDLDPSRLPRSGESSRLSIENLTIKETPAEVWTINRVALVTSSGLSSDFRLCYRAQRQA